MDNHKIPLLGHTLDELKAIAIDNGLPAFAGKQMAVWLYDKHVETIEEMTNISKKNRERVVSLWKPCIYPTATAPRCAFRVK